MTEEKQATPEQSVTPDLAGLLRGFAGAPSSTDIEKWKQQFGEVFVSGFSELELFVWHPLQRVKHLELQKKMREASEAQQMAIQQGDKDAEMTFDFEEEVVKACIVWSSNESAFQSKAGSIPTLAEQIMTHSNFVPPAMSSMLVMKL